MGLTLTFMGFSGRISRWPAEKLKVSKYHLSPSGSLHWLKKENTLFQALHPRSDRSSLQQSAGQGYLLLAGVLFEDTPHLLEQIAHCLKEARYHDLPAGEYCGCFVTPQHIWFWKTHTCNETIFYTHTSSRLCWSTNPEDLVENDTLSHTHLLQCCAGEDVFLYQNIEWVQAGTVVCFRRSEKKEIHHLFQRTALSRSRRFCLPELAESCRHALLEATRPLAQSHRPVGILLSGGIDSAAVAAALRQHGTEVIAYHFHNAFPAADELAYAQATAQALSLPLSKIEVDTDARYLSNNWRFPHPYGHAAYRWMEQAAEQVSRDGISLLVTGRGGDLAFGPLRSYGLSDIFSAPIELREKLAMTLGALSTDWRLSDLLASIRPSRPLISESSLSKAPTSPPAIPFFREQPSTSNGDMFDSTRFSPQDLVLEKRLWQPHGIRVMHPFYAPAIQDLARSIPTAYRLLPIQGMKVTKPVLRLAWKDVLPPAVLRYRRSAWTRVPHQDYCIRHASDLMELLTRKEAHVVQRGIVDPARTQEVLSRTRDIRAWYDVLIATAMTELFLANRTTHL